MDGRELQAPAEARVKIVIVAVLSAWAALALGTLASILVALLARV
jgi:hypothetical protein